MNLDEKEILLANTVTWWLVRVANTLPKVAQFASWHRVTTCSCTQEAKQRNRRTMIRRSVEGITRHESCEGFS